MYNRRETAVCMVLFEQLITIKKYINLMDIILLNNLTSL